MRPTRTRPEVRIAASAAELEAHFRVRRDVFVHEQRVFDETDRDIWDDTAFHAVAVLGPIVVGTVRFYRLDEAGLWQGDRLAVLPDARRTRPGGDLVRLAVRTAGELGGNRMIAHVQEPNVAFFQHLGWSRLGGLFPYHGIEHQRMDIPLLGAWPDASSTTYGFALSG